MPTVAPPARETLPPALLPEPVRALLEQLRAHAHEAVLVGGCVRDLLRGRPATDFDVATSAPPETVLHLFARAIPTGLRHGTVTVPTAAGPVDVTTFRAGPHCEDDLARRDFTINAVAWSPGDPTLIDPFAGVRDLREGRLRAVGSAQARFAEDPLRALRAARLVATLGLEPDPEIETAMAKIRPALREVARERVRRELEALLGAPRPSPGLALLRRSGIEADLAPGVDADAHELVDALPSDRALRLAGWLRGTEAGTILARLRFPKAVAMRVDHWVRLHPLDGGLRSLDDAAVRRLLRRAGADGIGPLLRLREGELRVRATKGDREAAEALTGLASLHEAIERVRSARQLALRRGDLSIDGREVMRVLGCDPGPRVGQAMRYLTERVIEDPANNTPEVLRELLLRWSEQAEDASDPHPRAFASESK